jgi:hypothetical protein
LRIVQDSDLDKFSQFIGGSIVWAAVFFRWILFNVKQNQKNVQNKKGDAFYSTSKKSAVVR